MASFFPARPLERRAASVAAAAFAGVLVYRLSSRQGSKAYAKSVSDTRRTYERASGKAISRTGGTHTGYGYGNPSLPPANARQDVLQRQQQPRSYLPPATFSENRLQ